MTRPQRAGSQAPVSGDRRRPVVHVLVVGLLLAVVLLARSPWLAPAPRTDTAAPATAGSSPSTQEPHPAPAGGPDPSTPRPTSPAATSFPASTGTSTTTTAAAADEHAEYESPAPRADDADLQRAAARFVGTWLDVRGGHHAWLARLTPLAEPDLLQGLALTDLTQLPLATIRGPGRVMYASHRDALVQVPTTAGNLTVVLARAPDQAAAPAVSGATPAPVTAPGPPIPPGPQTPTRWLVRSLAPERS